MLNLFNTTISHDSDQKMKVKESVKEIIERENILNKHLHYLLVNKRKDKRNSVLPSAIQTLWSSPSFHFITETAVTLSPSTSPPVPPSTMYSKGSVTPDEHSAVSSSIIVTLTILKEKRYDCVFVHISLGGWKRGECGRGGNIGVIGVLCFSPRGGDELLQGMDRIQDEGITKRITFVSVILEKIDDEVNLSEYILRYFKRNTLYIITILVSAQDFKNTLCNMPE